MVREGKGRAWRWNLGFKRKPGLPGEERFWLAREADVQGGLQPLYPSGLWSPHFGRPLTRIKASDLGKPTVGVQSILLRCRKYCQAPLLPSHPALTGDFCGPAMTR